MNLLIDMNLSPRWVEVLTRAGHRAQHWSKVGAPDAPDAAVMDFAREHDCVLLTHDLDFGAMLAASGARTPSVVQVRADALSPDAIAPQILAALRQLEPDLRAGALVTVDPARTRLTILPLRVGG